jgi:membrane-bound serine protease (ClpP class)
VAGRLLRALLGSIVAAAAALALAGTAGAAQPRVLAIHFDMEVNPVTQDYLSHQLERAADGHYAAAVIVIDTPGGLSESMRKIVQKELGLPIPVIVYVAPPGARAASAGVWITEAGDIAAMGPETNIGSSTPINGSGANIGSDLRRKVINDAAASLRALMASHHRNAAWGDAAVRQASNLTADEAVRMHVVDLVSPSLPALLSTLDGRKTIGPGRHFVLHTAGAAIVEAHPGFFTRLLNALIDPNILTLLFLAGLGGIGYEVFHPGVVLPGALGAVSLVTALFGFSVLPISWAGLALILLGAALFVADAHVTSHGALTVAGLVSLVVGALMLFHNAPSPYHTSVPLVVTIAVVLGTFWAFLLGKAVQARRRPVAVGPQEIIGQIGQVRRGGLVAVRGELWRARAPEGEELPPGETVEVTGIEDGLVLDVRRVEAKTPERV